MAEIIVTLISCSSIDIDFYKAVLFIVIVHIDRCHEIVASSIAHTFIKKY